MRLAVGSPRRTWVAMWVAPLLVTAFSLMTSSAVRAADGLWTQIPPPDFRFGHSAVYDRHRHQMIVFGGTGNGLEAMNDVWALELSYPNRWRRLLPTGTPPGPRRQHAAVYDAVHQRMIVFGGGTFDNMGWHLNNEAWALELTGIPHWTQLTATGAPPSPRFSMAMVYDGLRDRILMFGGGNEQGQAIGDMWSLSLSGTPAWTQISATTPVGPRVLAAAVVDSVRDRMVVMGGITDTQSLSDTWTVPLSSGIGWTELTTIGAAPATLGHGGVYDPLHDQMIVFGGLDQGTEQYLMGAWRLRFNLATPTWTRGPLSGNIPPPAVLSGVIYDPIADAVRGFAGWGGDPSTVNQQVWTLWLHPSPNWGASLPSNAPPATGRGGASLAYDAVHHRVYMFGGTTSWPPVGPQNLNDVWMLDLAATPIWTPVTPTGTLPLGRAFATMVYDPSGDRLVVHGGEDINGARFADLWSLSLAGTPAWTQLGASGTPPIARSRHGAVYDPARDRMLMFGGNSLIFPYYQNDVWSLSLGASPSWTLLTPTGTPPSRRSAAAVALDAARDRMLVFGGLSDQPPVLNRDVWTLDLSGTTAWDSLEVAVGPVERQLATAVCDPNSNRLLVFGGAADFGSGQTPANDLWSLALTGPSAWTELHPDGVTQPDAAHAAVFDVAGNRMIKYGGGSFGTHDGTWIYQPAAALDAPPPIPVAGDVQLRATPNPSRGGFDLSFTLPAAGRAQLGIFDLTGRRVARLVDATLPAGPRASRWDGRIGDDAAPPGVYFVRFEHPGGVATMRVLLIR